LTLLFEIRKSEIHAIPILALLNWLGFLEILSLKPDNRVWSFLSKQSDFPPREREVEGKVA
jgi:hypothetical protein